MAIQFLVNINFGKFTQGTLADALAYALMALGVFITFKILDFPDLTVDSSFVTGASISAAVIAAGGSAFGSLILALIGGALAGFITGFLHTKVKIPPILASILTMLGLWSINYAIMRKGNLKIDADKSIYAPFDKNQFFYENVDFAVIIVAFILVALTIVFLYWFFGTEYGSAIRATGKNEEMIRAQGVNTDRAKMVALSISNALVAVSGVLISNRQGFSEISMGIGTIIMGLAAIVIADVIFSKFSHYLVSLISVVVGIIIYRFIISLVLLTNINSSYIKLLSAMIVISILAVKNILDKKNIVLSKAIKNMVSRRSK